MAEYMNVHIQKWNEYTRKMADAMQAENVEEADRLKTLADKEYELYREDAKMTYECKNFGLANYVFENVLPSIFKTNKKLVNQFTNIIKEDKNLMGQFMFYTSLNNFNNDNAVDFINEALSLVNDRVDYKTIKKSNEKLASLIKENHIINTEIINEDKLKFFENCDFLLTNKKKLSNLNSYTEKINEVAEYVKKNIKPLNENRVNVFNLIEAFDKKYDALLNEEEKSFVQEIADFKKKGDNSKKQSFFESLKKSCLDGINTMIESCSENEKQELLSIKEEINNKMFCEDTLIKDVAKLLELRDVLLEK